MSETKENNTASKPGETDKPASGITRFSNHLLATITSQSLRSLVGAIFASLIIGAVLVVAFNDQVHTTLGYVFARPSDFLAASWDAFSGFFTSLTRGAIFDWKAPSLATAFIPLTETMTRAVPLIIAGLAIAVSFRAGMFNIGVQGQLVLGAITGGFVGFYFHLPWGIHLLLAIIAAIMGGALWGAIPGFLRAYLQANEVIVTIMLNSIASFLLAYVLSTKVYVGDGIAGKSRTVADEAFYPLLLGSSSRLHLGFLVAIGATIFLWWLLERSTFGFELRAAGANPDAARTAGINVQRVILITLIISGALAGLAATAPVLGTEGFISIGVAGSFGFDAITVALLGKSRPWGTFAAGLLFGALNAGSAVMQSSSAIPVDIVQITQAVIVLLIAASDGSRYYQEKKLARRTAQKALATKAEETSVGGGK